MFTEVPAEKSFLTVVLSELGAKSFSCLEDSKPGEREVYYIDVVRRGGITQAPMLLGQFITEFEKCPDAFDLKPGGTNRLYFPGIGDGSHPGDKRIAGYDELTHEEIEKTHARMTALAKKHPKAAELLQHL